MPEDRLSKKPLRYIDNGIYQRIHYLCCRVDDNQ